MTLSAETLLVAALMMAVFAAVSTVGTSLFLGAGFERLRAGFETIKKQTAFFSDSIHSLDQRVECVEKQSGYFFEAITNLEQEKASPEPADEMPDKPSGVTEEKLILSARNDALSAGTESLLTSEGFGRPAEIKLSQRFIEQARKPKPEPEAEHRIYFH